MPLLSKSRSIVASWNVDLPEGLFSIEFEHGSASGKRVIWINGKELYRKDFMFRLVGPEVFHIGRFQFKIDVDPDGALGLNYSLSIDGLSVEQFRETCKKKFVTWTVLAANRDEKQRVVLERDTMDVWVNGEKTETNVQFVDEGNLISFSLTDLSAAIQSINSGNKKQGMLYQLTVNKDDIIIQEDE